MSNPIPVLQPVGTWVDETTKKIDSFVMPMEPNGTFSQSAAQHNCINEVTDCYEYAGVRFCHYFGEWKFMEDTQSNEDYWIHYMTNEEAVNLGLKVMIKVINRMLLRTKVQRS